MNNLMMAHYLVTKGDYQSDQYFHWFYLFQLKYYNFTFFFRKALGWLNQDSCLEREKIDSKRNGLIFDLSILVWCVDYFSSIYFPCYHNCEYDCYFGLEDNKLMLQQEITMLKATNKSVIDLGFMIRGQKIF